MSQAFKRLLAWKEIRKHTLCEDATVECVCVCVCVLASQMPFCSPSLFMAEQIINEKQDGFCFSWRAQTHSTPPLLTRPRFEELIWTICMQMMCHFSSDIYYLSSHLQVCIKNLSVERKITGAEARMIILRGCKTTAQFDVVIVIIMWIGCRLFLLVVDEVLHNF